MAERVWTLTEIREAYRQSLAAYSEMIMTQVRVDHGTEDETFGNEDFDYLAMINRKLGEVTFKAKEVADSRVTSWHRGEPLDSLGQKFKERIEIALKKGV